MVPQITIMSTLQYYTSVCSSALLPANTSFGNFWSERRVIRTPFNPKTEEPGYMVTEMFTFVKFICQINQQNYTYAQHEKKHEKHKRIPKTHNHKTDRRIFGINWTNWVLMRHSVQMTDTIQQPMIMITGCIIYNWLIGYYDKDSNLFTQRPDLQVKSVGLVLSV